MVFFVFLGDEVETELFKFLEAAFVEFFVFETLVVEFVHGVDEVFVVVVSRCWAGVVVNINSLFAELALDFFLAPFALGGFFEVVFGDFGVVVEVEHITNLGFGAEGGTGAARLVDELEVAFLVEEGLELFFGVLLAGSFSFFVGEIFVPVVGKFAFFFELVFTFVSEGFDERKEEVGAEVEDLAGSLSLDKGVGLLLEVSLVKTVKRVVFVFPTFGPFAFFLAIASEPGGLVLDLFGARRIFEGGGNEGREEGVVDLATALYHAVVVDFASFWVGVGLAERGVHVVVGSAFDAVQGSTFHEDDGVALDVVGEVSAGLGVVFLEFAGDIFVEGERAVDAGRNAGRGFVKGAGGF